MKVISAMEAQKLTKSYNSLKELEELFEEIEDTALRGFSGIDVQKKLKPKTVKELKNLGFKIDCRYYEGTEKVTGIYFTQISW